MIDINLVLKIGKLNKRSELDQFDEYDLSSYENAYDLLTTHYDDDDNYAELKLELNLVDEPDYNREFLFASFKKVITKTKSGKKVYWVLV